MFSQINLTVDDEFSEFYEGTIVFHLVANLLSATMLRIFLNLGFLVMLIRLCSIESPIFLFISLFIMSLITIGLFSFISLLAHARLSH